MKPLLMVRHSIHSRFFVPVTVAFLLCSTLLRGQENAIATEQAVDDPSPDHRFAFLTIHHSEREPQRTCDLIEKDKGKTLLRVAESDEGKDRLDTRALWSADSKRFALFAIYNHFGAELSVYSRTGDTFRKLKLPDFSAPEFSERLQRGHEWKWTEINSASAERWQRNGTLVVRAESTLHAINSSLVLTSQRMVVLGFSKAGKVTILKSRQQVNAHHDYD